MKTKLVALSLLTAALTATVVVARPFDGPGRGRGCWEEGQGPEMGRGFARFAEKVGLTEEQKSRIQEIRAAEREKVQPLLQSLRANRKTLRGLAEAETFDEAAVRALAAEQAKLKTELTVSQLKVRSEVRALLTPEQRELAGKLRPFGRGSRGARGFHGGE
jgi:protein CpxP